MFVRELNLFWTIKFTEDDKTSIYKHLISVQLKESFSFDQNWVCCSSGQTGEKEVKLTEGRLAMSASDCQVWPHTRRIAASTAATSIKEMQPGFTRKAAANVKVSVFCRGMKLVSICLWWKVIWMQTRHSSKSDRVFEYIQESWRQRRFSSTVFVSLNWFDHLKNDWPL